MTKKTVDRSLEALVQLRSFTSAFLVILTALISAFLIQHMGFQFLSPTAGTWGSNFILLLSIGSVVYFRRQLFSILTSYQFAVSVLATSTVAVILGTLIVQHAPPADYVALYGRPFAALIQSFFLDDLFHSFWFASLMILTASSLFLVLLKRNPLRPAQLGFLLSHGGIILILAGGLTGYFYSRSGMIHLNEGESSSFMELERNGVYTREKLDLGFDLKLEDFQVEYYPAAFKIYAYRLDPETREYPAVGSYKLKQGSRHKIPGSDTEVVLRNVTMTDSTASAEIQATSPKGAVNAILTSQKDAPLYLNNGETILIIDKRDAEVREYRSLVSIHENGSERRRAVIQVNQPLQYKGFSLYQANYDPENPGYSGIQAVKDPGLGMVYAGFTLMSLGVVFIFYIRPKLVQAGRKRQEVGLAV